MKNVILLFGGRSPEHDISVLTALEAERAIDKAKYNVVMIYISHEGKWFKADKYTKPQDFVCFDEKAPRVFLKAGDNTLWQEGKFRPKALMRVDCAVNLTHGTNGEDGILGGVLEACNVPATSAGVAASALCMDKVFMKQIFEANNLPTVRYVWFKKCDFLKNPKKILKQIKENLDLPVVVKPANLGSSIGISVAKTEDDVLAAIQVAGVFDEKILVEEAVGHLKEFNLAAYEENGKVCLSEIKEMPLWEEFFDFDKKYLAKNIKTMAPRSADVPRYVKKEMMEIVRQSYKLFDLGGVVRVDFLMDAETEEFFVGEINTIPGSMAHYMFDMPYGELLEKQIEEGIRRFEKRRERESVYKSSVLEVDEGGAK